MYSWLISSVTSVLCSMYEKILLHRGRQYTRFSPCLKILKHLKNVISYVFLDPLFMEFFYVTLLGHKGALIFHKVQKKVGENGKAKEKQ